MTTISPRFPATRWGRNRHVVAYRRLVVSLVLAVPTIFVLGQLIDGPTSRWASYRGLRYSGAAGVGRPTSNIIGCLPLHTEFVDYLMEVFTSAPIVAVLLSGLACTLLVEARKRSGGRDR
ncbi:hypothetical protein [Halomicrobium salinisoli]|uniref:hypothetical protein n=1 Tax=Halomicrobium salinisoli TaxID=2878391 RepID=UPI001CF0615A|nr:hypothetical protein [Halomicrobium salinisoli]